MARFALLVLLIFLRLEIMGLRTLAAISSCHPEMDFVSYVTANFELHTSQFPL
jgi:hypothetical protein